MIEIETFGRASTVVEVDATTAPVTGVAVERGTSAALTTNVSTGVGRPEIANPAMPPITATPMNATTSLTLCLFKNAHHSQIGCRLVQSLSRATPRRVRGRSRATALDRGTWPNVVMCGTLACNGPRRRHSALRGIFIYGPRWCAQPPTSLDINVGHCLSCDAGARRRGRRRRDIISTRYSWRAAWNGRIIRRCDKCPDSLPWSCSAVPSQRAAAVRPQSLPRAARPPRLRPVVPELRPPHKRPRRRAPLIAPR